MRGYQRLTETNVRRPLRSRTGSDWDAGEAGEAAYLRALREVRRKGTAQAKRFDWRTTAAETLQVYDKVLNQRASLYLAHH